MKKKLFSFSRWQKFLALFLLTGFSFQSALFAQESPLWMRYPSISPDGSTIVFSYKGDLYQVAASGGTANPLTTHSAHDFYPIWSNDGKQIAFASNRYGNFDVFVMPATGGKATRLTFHSNTDIPMDFSPDNQQVIFSALRQDRAEYAQYPYARLTEAYQVGVNGGRPQLVSSISMEDAQYSSDGSKILYHDCKGYENQWRKHHTSSVTRDVWVYDTKKKKYTMLTDFEGEDRNPLFAADGKSFYYLSESSGSFNVFKAPLDNPSEKTALTTFENHPVRFLSKSDTDLLCFSFDGEIYTMTPGETPKKVAIQIFTDPNADDYTIESVSSGATEMALSPNGKEVAFVFRGEVFVAPVEGGDTKRITNTPSQERSVSFSPDGRSLLYAGERDNSWNVYQSTIKREEEKYFYASTLLEEKVVVATAAEEFQPSWSPDGKEVAYLEERVILKVINLESKKTRTILPAEHNYSYSDGDQHYDWSPDGKWFLVEYNQPNQWISEAGLVAADGKGEIINLTQSGFSDNGAQWMMEGNMMLWFSDRDGMKNRGSWGSESDVYGMFFNQEAYDRFRLSKEDFELLKEQEKDKKKDEKKEDAKDEKPKSDLPEVKIEMEGLADRKARLTIHSSRLSDAVVDNEGENLYYITRFEQGVDLWKTNLRTRETKILTKLGNGARDLTLDKEGKNAFVLSGGGIKKIDLSSGKTSSVSLSGEMYLDRKGERAYIFEHSWRQVLKKFYVKDLHGVDWEFYKKEYQKFLPHINNNFDFAEMLSELLGELNASHTGAGYRASSDNPDATASLGLFFDPDHQGNGLKVAEVLNGGPLDKASSKVEGGTIIEMIDGNTIAANTNWYPMLNRKAGKKVLLSLYNPKGKERWEEVVEPISFWTEYDLLYDRWVDMRRAEVEKKSDGKVGYVHVRGMDDASFRTVYEEVLGRNYSKESIIVDTRFNGGGWLHDDLATFLSGVPYIKFFPRGQNLGNEPQFKWTKPSVVLVGEGNYSDAHMFPYAYRANNLGKIIGMPVPGTGTAVWWETQIDPTLYFGIPQVGMVDLNGNYLENQQLEPDIKVRNEPEKLLQGDDQQISKAVEVLLAEKVQLPKSTKLEKEKKN